MRVCVRVRACVCVCVCACVRVSVNTSVSTSFNRPDICVCVNPLVTDWTAGVSSGGGTAVGASAVIRETSVPLLAASWREESGGPQGVSVFLCMYVFVSDVT